MESNSNSFISVSKEENKLIDKSKIITENVNITDSVKRSGINDNLVLNSLNTEKTVSEKEKADFRDYLERVTKKIENDWCQLIEDNPLLTREEKVNRLNILVKPYLDESIRVLGKNESDSNRYCKRLRTIVKGEYLNAIEDVRTAKFSAAVSILNARIQNKILVKPDSLSDKKYENDKSVSEEKRIALRSIDMWLIRNASIAKDSIGSDEMIFKILSMSEKDRLFVYYQVEKGVSQIGDEMFRFDAEHHYTPSLSEFKKKMVKSRGYFWKRIPFFKSLFGHSKNWKDLSDAVINATAITEENAKAAENNNKNNTDEIGMFLETAKTHVNELNDVIHDIAELRIVMFNDPKNEELKQQKIGDIRKDIKKVQNLRLPNLENTINKFGAKGSSTNTAGIMEVLSLSDATFSRVTKAFEWCNDPATVSKVGAAFLSLVNLIKSGGGMTTGEFVTATSKLISKFADSAKAAELVAETYWHVNAWGMATAENAALSTTIAGGTVLGIAGVANVVDHISLCRKRTYNTNALNTLSSRTNNMTPEEKAGNDMMISMAKLNKQILIDKQVSAGFTTAVVGTITAGMLFPGLNTILTIAGGALILTDYIRGKIARRARRKEFVDRFLGVDIFIRENYNREYEQADGKLIEGVRNTMMGRLGFMDVAHCYKHICKVMAQFLYRKIFFDDKESPIFDNSADKKAQEYISMANAMGLHVHYPADFDDIKNTKPKPEAILAKLMA